MSAELLINVTPSESRVALIENGILQEIHVERHTKRGLVGNIYRGKVSRVLPGMQAAFVDIGMEKAAFLHASDIITYDDEKDQITPHSNTARDIKELVREGQKRSKALNLIFLSFKTPLAFFGFNYFWFILFSK